MVSGIPFDGPIGAVRLSRHGERVDRAPHVRGERRVHLRARRRRSQDRRRRHRHHDGGGRWHRGHLAPLRRGRAEGDRRGHRRRARRGQAVDRRVDRPPEGAASPRSSREHGPIEPIAYEIHTDYDDDVFDAVAELATANTSEAMAIADKTERNDRLDEILEGAAARAVRHARRARSSSPLAPGRSSRAFRSLQKKVVRTPHRQRGPAHRRSRHHRPPAALGRGRAHPDGARLRPLPAGRDAGAQRPHARHAPHGAVHRPRRAARHHQALHPPLQLPALLHRRDRPRRFAEAP